MSPIPEDTRALRRAVTSRPPLPYVPLTGAAWREVDTSALLESGWECGTHPPVSLVEPIDWDAAAARGRGFAFHLHSWDSVSLLLLAHQETDDLAFVDAAVRVVTDWISHHKGFLDEEREFPWYDMAVGLRAGILGSMIETVARQRDYSDDQWMTLVRSAVLHDEYLVDDARIAWHSNHGVYQLAGHLALSRRLFPIVALSDPDGIEERLARLLTGFFTSDGVHKEHSPGYQLAMTWLMEALSLQGVVESDHLIGLRNRSKKVIAGMTAPDGALAMFGDTDRGSNPTILRLPQPPDSPWGSGEGGYFVARDEGDSGSSFLAMIAGFHSRTHKHADDLAIEWFARGQHVLVDSGRFGYEGATVPGSEDFERGFWYSDPRRMYVESTRAHNTVQIDDDDHQRRGRSPYGSALVRWGEVDGVTFAEAHVRHGSVRHERTLLSSGGEWLIVFDWLRDDVAESHRLRQWLHLDPGLRLGRLGRRIPFVVRSGTWEQPLHVVALLPGTKPIVPVRGATKPQIQGWWSPLAGRFERRWAFGFEVDGTPSHGFATLFAFGEAVESDHRTSRVDELGRAGCFRWVTDGIEMTLAFERPEGSDMDFVVSRR